MKPATFSKMSGLSKGFISRWVRGQAKVGRQKTAQKLADKFGKTPAWWASAPPEEIKCYIKKL